MKLRKGCYNVRIVVDKDGMPSVKFVHRLYSKNSKLMEWDDAPHTTRKTLEEALVKGTKFINA